MKHPLHAKGALTVAEVQPEMRLFYFNHRHELTGIYEVKEIKKLDTRTSTHEHYTVVSRFTPVNPHTYALEEQWPAFDNPASNLGLEPGMSGDWNTSYSVSEETLIAQSKKW